MIEIRKQRFRENMARHPELSWETVERRLTADSAAILVLALLLLTGCTAGGLNLDAPAAKSGYRQIDQETARQMMAQDDGHVVVDVRRLDEYEGGHIPGAICIPNESIDTERPEELPNLDQIILIYCRSGNRSKQAAEKLVKIGYVNLYEFGGIIDWTGEVVTGQTLALTVKSNPTTGFQWEAAQDQELFAVQSDYLAEPRSGPVSGAGGRQRFLLTPRAPGTVRLTFTYARPWEEGGSAAQFSCAVEIDENLMITVNEDDIAAAADSGYRPTVKIY